VGSSYSCCINCGGKKIYPINAYSFSFSFINEFEKSVKEMKKALLVLSITFFTTQFIFSQIGYGYTGDKRANIDDWSKMVKEYRNNEQRGLDESEFDKLTGRVREKAARELGWSSYAEMAAARKKKKKQLRNERKMQELEHRVNKRKRNAELRRIKKEERLKRKKKKPKG